MFWLVLAFLLVFSNVQVQAEGFLAGTRVKILESDHLIAYKKIEDFVVGDSVISSDLRGENYVQKIARTHKISSSGAQENFPQNAHGSEQEKSGHRVIFASLDGETIGMAPDQRFYCQEHAQWVIAQDCAQCGICDHLFDDIWAQDYDVPVTFYAITLDTSSALDASPEIYPHFYVTSRDLIVHNVGPGVVMIPGIVLGAAATSPVAAVGILGCAAWGIKKLVDELRFRSKNCTRDSAGSRAEQNFDKNYRCPYHLDCHRPHPHGLHSGVPYHGKVSRGGKSAGPIDGQLALDFSVKVSKSQGSNRRVGLSCGQIVVLMYTGWDAATGQHIWHGHVPSVDEVKGDIETALKREGWLSGNGKMRLPDWGR